MDEKRITAAMSGIVRWASRPEVRRAMCGDSSGETAVVLSPTEQWLLDQIERCGPLRMSELAQWQHVDRSTITAQIGRLESRGLVLRAHGEADRRAVLVDVTPAGRAALAAAQHYAERRYAELVANWPADDLRRFADLLTTFAAGLDSPPSAPTGRDTPQI